MVSHIFLIKKMKKAGYGLYDASHLRWVKVMEEITKLGGKTLVGDVPLVYFHHLGIFIGLKFGTPRFKISYLDIRKGPQKQI